MLAAITIAALLAAAPVNAVMQWSIQATSGGNISFETRYRAVTTQGNNSSEDGRDYPAADLENTFRGLTHAQLFGPETNVRFTVTRQEGSIVCSGRARGGSADGDFTFTLDPAIYKPDAKPRRRNGFAGTADGVAIRGCRCAGNARLL